MVGDENIITTIAGSSHPPWIWKPKQARPAMPQSPEPQSWWRSNSMAFAENWNLQVEFLPKKCANRLIVYVIHVTSPFPMKCYPVGPYNCHDLYSSNHSTAPSMPTVLILCLVFTAVSMPRTYFSQPLLFQHLVQPEHHKLLEKIVSNGDGFRAWRPRVFQGIPWRIVTWTSVFSFISKALDGLCSWSPISTWEKNRFQNFKANVRCIRKHCNKPRRF